MEEGRKTIDAGGEVDEVAALPSHVHWRDTLNLATSPQPLSFLLLSATTFILISSRQSLKIT